MIELKNLTLAHEDHVVFDHLNLTIPEGKVTCLFGPSGCGKTTLLKLIAGLIKPDSGTITGTENLNMSMVFQEDRLLPWRRVFDNVRLVCSDEEAEKRLKQVGLYEEKDSNPQTLSGGMKRRVALARALAYPCDLLLLDEPMAGVDDETAFRLMNEIREEFKNKTVIFITHNRPLAEKFSDELIELIPTRV